MPRENATYSGGEVEGASLPEEVEASVRKGTVDVGRVSLLVVSEDLKLGLNAGREVGGEASGLKVGSVKLLESLGVVGVLKGWRQGQWSVFGESAMDEMERVSPSRVAANWRTRMVGSETPKLLSSFFMRGAARAAGARARAARQVLASIVVVGSGRAGWEGMREGGEVDGGRENRQYVSEMPSLYPSEVC